jgi:hypothetical protein
MKALICRGVWQDSFSITAQSPDWLHAAAGHLQQRPTAAEGGLFKREWFANPVKFVPEGLQLVCSRDLASASDTNAEFRSILPKRDVRVTSVYPLSAQPVDATQALNLRRETINMPVVISARGLVASSTNTSSGSWDIDLGQSGQCRAARANMVSNAQRVDAALIVLTIESAFFRGVHLDAGH